MADDLTSGVTASARPWRGPTIRSIAKVTGLGTATIDRVLNNRPGVREATRVKVHEALALFGDPPPDGAASTRARISVICDSGPSFIGSFRDAVRRYGAGHSNTEFSFTGLETAAVDLPDLARLIETAADSADGLVLVAREALAINRAVRSLTARGVPVACVTSDLPASDRTFYVGNDQSSAGSAAAYLMGKFVAGRPGKILLVISAPYRSQEERELGFRRVLRAEFPHLEIQDRVNSNDSVEYSHRSVADYVRDHGAPIGVYNLAGGNLGVARALRDAGLQGKTIFIGHELNANSRILLEGGEMDVVVGHDLDDEMALAVDAVTRYLRHGTVAGFGPTPIRIHTKYNCA
nr:LacI family DNA-binding transcriptional regulator [uncultured Lichenicoccus sp.]